MRYAPQFFVHDSSPYCRQEFYKELLTDEYRKNRFFELGKREGMSEYKIKRCLHDGQVPLWIKTHCLGDQVPLSFAFLDVHPKKGLNEDMVFLA